MFRIVLSFTLLALTPVAASTAPEGDCDPLEDTHGFAAFFEERRVFVEK